MGQDELDQISVETQGEPQVPSAELPPMTPLKPQTPEPASQIPEPVSQVPPPETPSQPQPKTNTPSESKPKITDVLPLALAKRREKRAEKLEKIMNLARQKGRVTNDNVQKLVAVSDSTAQRYLRKLERQGKLKASAKAGRHTHYLPT